MVINRAIQPRIEDKLFQGKIIVIYGARRVGKTTLVKKILSEHSQSSVYFNCDEPDIREAFSNKTSTELKLTMGNNKLVILDEAQRVKNIGITLKLLVDTYPQIQVIATGSSSFDLSNEIVEPLTGRKYEFYLYPLSLSELEAVSSPIEIKRTIGERLKYGMYPEIFVNPGKEEEIVSEIKRSYLYKDIFQYQQLKNTELMEKLLQALALQIGSEVSYTELASLLSVDKKTIERYLELLKKAFVIFQLPPYSRNLRKELSKTRKIYFFDIGVRNALLKNFNNMDIRQDTGALWENFLISERLKKNSNEHSEKNIYFWRTYQQQEVDYIEEVEGRLTAFEFKWGSKTKKISQAFTRAYKNSSIEIINKDNFFRFLGI
jgi:predicted AAA+ superfamily ATPase